MKDLESKSLSKQIKRYAQDGGVVGKLATKIASQKYLGVKIDKKKHAEEVRAALGGIKGPLIPPRAALISSACFFLSILTPKYF